MSIQCCLYSVLSVLSLVSLVSLAPDAAVTATVGAAQGQIPKFKSSLNKFKIIIISNDHYLKS